jgi:hypothetical protein
MEVNVNHSESLNIVDRNIISNIKKIVGGNKAFKLDIEHNKNTKGQNSTIFTFKGLKNSQTYIEDPIEMIRNKVHTISDGHFEYKISNNSASHVITFHLKPEGYIHAKGYYRGASV